MKFIIDLSWIVPFFNSAFFAGFATILTGLVAYFIFLRQKHDEKLKVARIILVEINDCENLLDNLKVNGINLTNIRQILPVNSWNKYKHLFAKDFDARELKLIDNFYQECSLLNQELNESYSLPNYWQEKAKIIAERHASFSEKSKNKEEYEIMKKKIKFFEEDTYWWQPNAPKDQMIQRIKLIKDITTTTVGEKIKEIARL
ncbi:hypothetical protein COV53_01410 [Candidatus Gottesmanbacteria bacterium CG11_big_fil_rev_8_21_14_0_20_37_11]|uniref:Uncharacterized protein n=2 Tax=Candidatus Gottesmaniibacteriota TaxID=1752720 RepID=A0A2M7RS67_9BACT|nr:MAG: hypothetical protein COX23_00710 [Candidatus Gottesmanbacteria bacterium CG23_combo_of_CG06-09_8_20_14_all_37_19]PIR08741.1 MAG: hypothetical protein COV53_01410 [Candidatus Gottesmanbacteria bacterium CG11_big_fil_rev_8_21_14_0_20_37_11]PIZ03161.1 MAG: hypothetical protein COY59_01015 [Candidatus Gottesmanbacteria bacterium CG_4_10_14_0_8_um_filter_37_24]